LDDVKSQVPIPEVPVTLSTDLAVKAPTCVALPFAVPVMVNAGGGGQGSAVLDRVKEPLNGSALPPCA
jgi:hypothetical protein